MTAELGTVTLIGLGALAAGSWLAVLWRKTGLYGLTLLTVLTSICLGYFFWHVEKPFPLSLDRILWGILIVALGADFLRRRTDLSCLTRADLFAGLLVIYLLISAVGVLLLTGGTSGLSRWLFFYAFPATLYVAARRCEITPWNERATLVVFSVLGVYLSLTGLAEVFGWNALVFPRYIADTSITDEFFGRARGPLLNPVANGFLILLGWTAWTVFTVQAPPLRRAMFLVGHGLFAAGVACTLTRSVWLSAAGCAVVVGAWITPSRFRAAWVTTALLMLMGAGLVAGVYFREMKRDRHLSAGEAARSVQLRPLLATAAWRMFQDRPVFGFGLAQYDQAKLAYLEDPTAPLPLRQAKPYTQHNVFLSLLVETGLIGLGLFGCFLAASAEVLRRHWGNPARPMSFLALVAVVAYVVNGLFHDVSIILDVNAVLFLMIGLAVRESSRDVADIPQNARLRSPVAFTE
ncbi:O-antigen ligase family protein [Thermogutta sp.]|uniref:O-antigen ligase family protein n=1 Tax=Thermogutta sp. TaxID=1962930 RepID=UPI00321FE0DB